MTRLLTKTANELSNLINQMLTGIDALRRAEARDPRVEEDVQYWYEYRLRAERELQDLGIHLAAPLE